MFTFTFPAMGSQVLVALDSEDPGALEQAHAAEQWFYDWEQILSRFKYDSELTRINNHSGTPTKVSNIMWEVLTLALHMEDWTDGLVTPLILNSVESAGYDVSFEHLPRKKFRPLENGAAIKMLQERIEMLPEDRSICLPESCRIDLGGIAKGWAAHQAMMQLSRIAPVLVDAGGDIAVSGPLSDDSGWPIAIARAYQDATNLDTVLLRNGGIATSGRDRRRWKMNGVWQHHIIDPRRRLPAETDVISATVIADDVMMAEAAAKTALILGSQDAPGWLASSGITRYLLQVENESGIEESYLCDYVRIN